jgi:hypothetical protein
MPKQFIDSTETFIYKIVCNDLNTDVYLGHTNFINRKAKHKSKKNTMKIKQLVELIIIILYMVIIFILLAFLNSDIKII